MNNEEAPIKEALHQYDTFFLIFGSSIISCLLLAAVLAYLFIGSPK